MSLLRAEGLSCQFGTHCLLNQVQFAIEESHKIALVGRNGTGKSTLLKLIAGVEKPDDGRFFWRKGYRLRYLKQTLPDAEAMPVFDFVAQGVDDLREASERFEQLSLQHSDEKTLATLHEFLDLHQGWTWRNRVEQTLQQLGLKGEQRMNELSGGWRRRASLAQCLVAEPDILLLDEPTNHLDVTSIEWLEGVLNNFSGALLLVSHDRAFIDAVVDSIWEIDRAQLRYFPAPYHEYVQKKNEQLEQEEKENAEFDKKLAQEEVWVRQGIKARRTRNEGRVRALKKMREQRKARIELSSSAQLEIKGSGISGKRVALLENVSLSRGDHKLWHDFSAIILKGDKVAIVGPNGCGKSSFLQMLLGELEPDEGTVELGTQLSIAYFDQMRSDIKPEQTIFDNLGEGRDFIEVGDEKRHVISYLSDYGFTPERMRTPVSALSGGEISRLYLAKLFTRPANLLILDEPTNDLDIETLELLESQIVNFNGTVIIISHDRRFIDNTATSLFVFEEDEHTETKLITIQGGYQDWLNYLAHKHNQEKNKTEIQDETQQKTSKSNNKIKNTKKLSYKLQKELDEMPSLLENIEKEIEQLEAEVSCPDFQKKPHLEQEKTYQQLSEQQSLLEEKLNRWEELESQ